MNAVVTIVQILICFIMVVQAETNPYVEVLKNRPWQSVQQYVEVRPGAHLFYWFYYAAGTSIGAERKPLIIWIQGGPGLAATGVANFGELGPLNMNMLPRNHTWVNGHNVLLIDHPVGTGFSYADDISLYAETDRQMAIDLSVAIKTFFRRHKEFRQTPTYIFGQSYGGKIAPRLGYYLYTAIEKKSLKINFKGIGIGGGWVNPRESLPFQSEYLYIMGVIDQSTYEKSMFLTRKIRAYIDREDYLRIQKYHHHLLSIFRKETGMLVNFNNINQVDLSPYFDRMDMDFNRYVKPTLTHVVNQSFEWRTFSSDVWGKLERSFFVPSVKFLELLLNNTELKIAVYNGNLDIATPLAGASTWVHKLNWPGREQFKNAKRIQINGFRNGFYKQTGLFSFWSVFGAGHWVPEDNPVAMAQILEHLTLET